MNNIKHWKISSITALVFSDTEVALFGQNEIKAISRFTKNLFNDCVRINMAGEVKLKLQFIKDDTGGRYSEPNWEQSIGIRLLIKSAEFPNPDNWYHLVNFYSKHLGNIIKQNKLGEDGEFEHYFSPIISPSADMVDYCSLVSDQMEEYDEYLEETVREMNCEVNKKTKKWIPGHRYDTPSETRILLCKTKVRRTGGEEYSELPTEDAWIYTNTIKGEKSISEVLKSMVFGEEPCDLKVMTSIPNGYVESGEVITNDYSGDINDYLRDILHNSKETFSKDLYKKTQNFYYYILPFLFENVQEIETSCYPYYLNSVLCELGYQCLYNIYDKKSNRWYYQPYREVGSDKSPKENAEILLDIIYYHIPDDSLDKIVYYNSMFKHYGVSPEKACETLVNTWDPRLFSKDLDTFLEHLDYFKERKTYADTNLDVRNSSIVVIKEENKDKKLSDFVGNQSLYNIIREMLEKGYCKQDKLLGGNKNYVYSEAEITVQDVLNYVKSKNEEIPQDLKNEILRHQFCSIHLMYDADKLIE